jgi:hypothetical protein
MASNYVSIQNIRNFQLHPDVFSGSILSSKMQSKQLTDIEKGKTLPWRELGDTYKVIGDRLGYCKVTIFKFVKKVEATGSTSRRPGSGKKRVTSDKLDRRILREQKKDWEVTAGEIKENLGLETSESTVKNRLHKMGLASYWKTISEKNQKARVAWTKGH